MKVVSVNSSFRENGNTTKIIRSLEANLRTYAKSQNEELIYEEISLGKENIKPCIGCRACFNKGEEYCPNKDSFLEIYNKLQAADAVVFGSPIYVEDISGTMKNLIDRMAFNSHRPCFSGISVTIITTSGAGATNHALNTLERAMNVFGFNTINKANFICGGNVLKNQLSEKYQRKILKISQNIVKYHLQNKKEKPSFYSLLVFSVQKKYWLKQTDKLDTIDYKYWQTHGWLDKKTKYYIKINKSNLRIFFARFIGSLISKLFY